VKIDKDAIHYAINIPSHVRVNYLDDYLLSRVNSQTKLAMHIKWGFGDLTPKDLDIVQGLNCHATPSLRPWQANLRTKMKEQRRWMPIQLQFNQSVRCHVWVESINLLESINR
jgi:hypothetical protein